MVAGAGTGKTSTLVDRCMNCLLEASPPASINEILMVTFTDAAAAEMRQRIRARLEEQLKAEPESSRWQEQLALFETAHIGTLHSFCLQLIRQHFYLLELDPQLSVLREEESWLVANEALDEILRHHYAGETPEAHAVQELIQVQGRGFDSGDSIADSSVASLHSNPARSGRMVSSAIGCFLRATTGPLGKPAAGRNRGMAATVAVVARKQLFRQRSGQPNAWRAERFDAKTR